MQKKTKKQNFLVQHITPSLREKNRWFETLQEAFVYYKRLKVSCVWLDNLSLNKTILFK